MPENPTSVEGLEDPKFLSHQRSEWWLSRGGWLAMGLLLAAALAGFLGPGPLGYRRASSSDGSIVLEYHAVQRNSAPADLRLQLHPAKDEQKEVRLAVSRSFADAITPEHIVPRPASVSASGNSIIYAFRLEDLQAEYQVTYRYEHDDFGIFDYEFSLAGRQPLKIRQYVCP